MAITFNTVKCPACGANLQVEEGRDRLFCSYCGTQIIVTNENEHIHRHIDETKIRKAQIYKEVELKRLEFLEKKRVAAARTKRIKIVFSIVLGIITAIAFEGAPFVSLICICAIAFIWGINNKDGDSAYINSISPDGIATVPPSITGYSKKYYDEIEKMFREAGFTNITCIPLKDLVMGIFDKPNTVNNITINGKSAKAGKRHPHNSAVIIYYHSFR